MSPASRKSRKSQQRSVSPKQQFMAYFKSGEYVRALTVVEKLIRKGVRDAPVYSDAAVCCVYLANWEKAKAYAHKALAIDPNNVSALDAMSHAAGAVKEWETVKTYGQKALQVRDASIPSDPKLVLPLSEKGPPEGDSVISFSLFGGSSKYCETAILNCLEQPEIYPGWICRFYVDTSVPDNVISRLTDVGGEVVLVDGKLNTWPGPMWRFAAYDDPDVKTVIFRDCDSVISYREAGAVSEWMRSPALFHGMRDAGTHTELMLAGLWGVRKGALPKMEDMVDAFLDGGVENEHFADQLFLRRFVWPYARSSIFQHDSLFDFMLGKQFPEGPHRDDFHVGYAEGSAQIAIETENPNGAKVEWYLTDQSSISSPEICRYPAIVRNGRIIANVPARYAIKINSGTYHVGVQPILD